MSTQTTTTAVPTKESDTIPVKYSFAGSLRRTTLGNPPRLNALRHKLAKSFPDHADRFRNEELLLTYKDDEGDVCTISTNEELLVAYRLAHEAGKVLRFFVIDAPTKAVKPEPVEPVQAEKADKEEVQPAPVPVVKPTETETAAPTAFFPDFFNNAGRVKEILGALVNGTTPVHFGHVCAQTGVSPIVGVRYQSVENENVSLCEGAFLELPADQRGLYHEVSNMSSARVRVPHFLKKHARFMGIPVHRRVKCDVTGLTPIIGKRYKLKGQNYDLCQFAYNQLRAEDQALYELVPENNSGRGRGRRFGRGRGRGKGKGRWARFGAWRDATAAKGDAVHVNITCDDCGVVPILGTRWHKRGADFDLCDADYQKLSDSEKSQFVCIKEPQSWRCGGNWGNHPFGGPFEVSGYGPQPPGLYKDWGAVPQNSPFVGRPFVGRGFGRGPWGAPAPCPPPQQVKPSAKFVKDLTVNDKSRKAPGQAFEKAWVMRAGETGVPAGCSLVFIGGHHLNAKNLRVAVENTPVASNQDFVLRIPFEAPSEPGHYRSFWRLQTSDGCRFGPRIWADIMVAEPQVADKDKKKPQYHVELKEHVTIAPGATVQPGETFRKTWLLNTNTGWGKGCVLKCIDMYTSFAGLSEAIPEVPPQSQAEVSISLTAPTQSGHYRSYWCLAQSDGKQIGEVIPIDFNVAAATPTPTVTATATATDMPTSTSTTATKTETKAKAKAAIVEPINTEAVTTKEADVMSAADAILTEVANALKADSPKLTQDATETEDKLIAQAIAASLAQTETQSGLAALKQALGIENLTDLASLINKSSNLSPDQQARLSDLLFRALSSNDFTSLVTEVLKLGLKF